MNRSSKQALLVQIGIFVVAFTTFYVLAQGPDDSGGYFEVSLFYTTWIPAFWGGFLGGFWTYLVLGILALGFFILSLGTRKPKLVIGGFHLTAVMWTHFPIVSYVFGSYNGP